MTYPPETIIRTHALFMEYVEIPEIARLLSSEFQGAENPPQDTIRRWVRDGTMTNGISWDYWRDVCAAKRARVDFERGIETMKREGYEDFVDRSLANLRSAQDAIIDKVSEGTIPMRMSDLKDIIKTQVLLHGRATERVQMEVAIVQIVGEILASRARQVISNSLECERLIDLVGEDFERKLVSGIVDRNATMEEVDLEDDDDEV